MGSLVGREGRAAGGSEAPRVSWGHRLHRQGGREVRRLDSYGLFSGLEVEGSRGQQRFLTTLRVTPAKLEAGVCSPGTCPSMCEVFAVSSVVWTDSRLRRAQHFAGAGGSVVAQAGSGFPAALLSGWGFAL